MITSDDWTRFFLSSPASPLFDGIAWNFGTFETFSMLSYAVFSAFLRFCVFFFFAPWLAFVSVLAVLNEDVLVFIFGLFVSLY